MVRPLFALVRRLGTQLRKGEAMKIKYAQNCRVCGRRMEPGTTVGQDDAGLWHAKSCQPKPADPRGTVRNPASGGETFRERAARIDREIARQQRRNRHRPEV